MANAKLLVQLKSLNNVPYVAPKAAANRIVIFARRRAAVDTGEMKSKIKARHYKYTSNVVAEAKHSGYVEFGTYKMKAQPFMRPAVDENKRAILNAVAEAIMAEIEVQVKGGWSPSRYAEKWTSKW